MKKSFIILAALLMMGSAVFAGGGFDIALGPKVGYQTATLSYQKDDIKAGFMNHFTVGLFGRVEIKGFYIQPEVMWFKTSNLFELNTNVNHSFNIGELEIPTGATVDITMNAMNIQVPVLLGYKFNIVENLIGVRAHVGPTFNYTFPQHTYVCETADNSHKVEVATSSFDTKAISFGFQGGVGVDVLRRITFDIDYNFGISRVFGAKLINNTEWGQYINTDNIANVYSNLFMVTVGFKIL